MTVAMPPVTISWVGDIDGHVRILDQTLLPNTVEYRDLRTAEEVWEAIKMLRVRGAPAIGIAAAFGVIVGLQTATTNDPNVFNRRLNEVCAYLASSRPTAVNLSWALNRLKRRYSRTTWDWSSLELIRRSLLEEALAIADEDRRMCRAIGKNGADLVPDHVGVLTHCNAGGLATSEYGTALAVLYAAHEAGRRFTVYADETRPLLQGARLTAWELAQHGLSVTLICDSMAAQVMKEGRIGMVVVGADRIAANGDTANKIGTYAVAVLAHAHGIPFYVAAPYTTFDLSLKTGDKIPIELRDPHEITHGFGTCTAPEGIQVYNPAFDVTPARLITGIITDKGLIRPVSEDAIRAIIR